MQLNGWLSFVCALEKQLCCNLFWTYIFKPMKTLVLKSNTTVKERHVEHMCMQTWGLWAICVCRGLHLTFLRNSLSCLGSVSTKWDKETTDGRMSQALSIKRFTICPKMFSGHGYKNEAPQFVVWLALRHNCQSRTEAARMVHKAPANSQELKPVSTKKRERNNIKLCTHTFSQAIKQSTPLEVSDIHMS